jgi:hypothetical protein
MKRPVGMLFVLLLLFPSAGQAASLYLDPGISTLARGDALKVSVRLDTDEASEECVNAVEGVLTFTGPIKPIDVSLGDSIFSLWVESPALNEAKTQVTFAGGIPNGYCGRVDGDPRLTNNLFDVIIRADSMPAADGESMAASVQFTSQTVAYLNDGFGTQAVLTTFPSSLTVLPELGEFVQDPWTEEIEADNIPPQPFSIQLEKDKLAFGGRYYIAFSTTDKQTGIDRYEVREELLSQFDTFSWGRANVSWIETRSPYVLKDQSLNSIIRVRAIDKAGNEYIATLVPDPALRTLSFTQFLTYVLFILLVLLAAVGAWFIARRRSFQKRRSEIEAIEARYTQIDHE